MSLRDAFVTTFEKISNTLMEWVMLIPEILLALIVLLVGIKVARFIRRVLSKRLQEKRVTNTVTMLILNLSYSVLVIFFIYLSLRILHLDIAIKTLLASAGILGLAMAFAFQEIVANFISGIFISLYHPFKVRDAVKIKDYTGTVVQIRLKDTIILTYEGQYVTIPNKEVFLNPVTNYTAYGKRRLDIKGGVSMDTDLKKVGDIVLKALMGIEGVIENETEFNFDNIGDFSYNFIINIWIDIKNRGNIVRVNHEAIIRLKEAFEKNNINLPYPIQTVDFSMTGGQLPVKITNTVPSN